MIMFNMDFIKIFLNGNYNLAIKKDLNLNQFNKIISVEYSPEIII
jgi:hypothetical protein